jgi:deoxyribodipyrimidine photo-lyase
MSRDQRAENNHALWVAAELSARHNLPLFVYFHGYLKKSVRIRQQFDFMYEGLYEVQEQLKSLGIPLIVTTGDLVSTLKEIDTEYSPHTWIMDFHSLVGFKRNIESLKKVSKATIIAVDTHNVVPVFVASQKQEWAAYTLRPKIHKLLPHFLKPLPQLPNFHTAQLDQLKETVSLQEVHSMVNASNVEGYVPTILPGRRQALKSMQRFIEEILPTYSEMRNDPSDDHQSNLSPYFHFGTLSTLEVALSIQKSAHNESEGANSFIDESFVRIELADNFCYYNEAYRTSEGIPEWAVKTLKQHQNDKREYVYTLSDLEIANTHDEAWNASQRQMTTTGKMHGYMRMYWAKKILEWTSSYDDAIKYAIYLNDKYELDGLDPNGYVGILWSIGGLHDRPWIERPIFGQVRYMNAAGLARKFDIQKYIALWKK